MRKRDADLLVGDMMECCTNIFEYTKGMTFDSFMQDKKTIHAVVRNFEVLGEAAKRVPEAVKSIVSGIEWRRISDFRNVLIHEYFGINYEILWKIIEDYLPGQYQLLKELFSKLS